MEIKRRITIPKESRSEKLDVTTDQPALQMGKSNDVSPFADALSIDPLALVEEWLRQAIIYDKWARKLVDANDDRDRAKQDLDLVKAEVDNDIREHSAKYFGDKKPTEAAIAAQVLMDDRYKKALEHSLQTSKTAAILAVGERALGHKKSALENITKLWLSDYYSSKPDGDTVKAQANMMGGYLQQQLNKDTKRLLVDGGNH